MRARPPGVSYMRRTARSCCGRFPESCLGATHARHGFENLIRNELLAHAQNRVAPTTKAPARADPVAAASRGVYNSGHITSIHSWTTKMLRPSSLVRGPRNPFVWSNGARSSSAQTDREGAT